MGAAISVFPGARAIRVPAHRFAPVKTTNDRTRADFMKLVKAHQVLDVHSRNGKPLDAEVQVITLGSDLAWVSLPGEVFVQLGLDLKLDYAGPIPAAVHLHGGEIPPNLDGGPDSWFTFDGAYQGHGFYTR